jgi:hypothetical protein
MAWRRPVPPPPRIEPPTWYRTFDPQQWDVPDAHEQSMMDGCAMLGPWPDAMHRIHAERRWGQAKHAYRQQHPALAEQEFRDLISREAKGRGAPG